MGGGGTYSLNSAPDKGFWGTFLRNIRRRSDFFKSFSFTDAVFKTIVQENFTNLPLTNNLMKSPLVKMSRLGKFKTGDGVLGFNAPFTSHFK